MDVALPNTTRHAHDGRNPESIAIACRASQETLSYRELAAEAYTFARALARLGLAQGDVVAYRRTDGLGLYPLAAACFRLGLRLRVLDRSGHLGTDKISPKLVLSPAEPGSSASEWLTLEELCLFGRDHAAAWKSAAQVWPLPDERCGLSWTVRRLRTPLNLLKSDCAAASAAGEIVLHVTAADPRAGEVSDIRTGDIGEITHGGGLLLEGRLSDIAVRHGHAVLLSHVDEALAQHPAVVRSISFRERGLAPVEPVIAVCETSVTAAELHTWAESRVASAWLPDRFVTIPALPTGPGREAVAAQLRAILDGTIAANVAQALTARRFRRNPCFKEDGLRGLVQQALLGGHPLEFLMFWGCGPRNVACAPDRVALEALGDLLSAVQQNAGLEARVDIVFTDAHATNNGHPASHYNSYFASVRDAAAGLNVAFHLESEVWRRAGLTKGSVCALEQTDHFAARWNAFSLRDRFMQQASRHSHALDPAAAARHYYATCLLERDVLKARFRCSVFLTYNGPEFNECFPDLPTLYIYPGPRGRTDKPWFVTDEPRDLVATGLAVAAE